MRKLKFFCENCGYEKELTEYELADNESCALCGKELMMEEEDFNKLIADDLDNQELEDMKINIRTRGNDKTWYAIENNIDNPYIRLRLRQQFFEVGGKNPKGKGVKI